MKKGLAFFLIALLLGMGSLAEAKVKKAKKSSRSSSKKKAAVKKQAPLNPLVARIFLVDPWPTAHRGAWTVYPSTRVAVGGETVEFKSLIPSSTLSQAQGEAACLKDPETAKRAQQVKTLNPGSTLDYFIVKSGVPPTQYKALIIGSQGKGQATVLWQSLFCRLTSGRNITPFVALVAQVDPGLGDPWIALEGAFPLDTAQPVLESERKRLEETVAKDPARDPVVSFAVLSIPQLKALAKNPKMYDVFQNALGTKWASLLLSPKPEKSLTMKTLLDLTKDGSWDLFLLEEQGDLEIKRSVYGKDGSGLPVLKGEIYTLLSQ